MSDNMFDNEENGFDSNSFKGTGRKSSQNTMMYFFGGIVLFAVGAFLISQNTILHMNMNSLSDYMGFNVPIGLILLPLLVGIGVLFFNGKSIVGWGLLIVGILIILLNILMGLKIYFKPVSLYYGIIMYGMTAAGAGLALKALFGKKK